MRVFFLFFSLYLKKAKAQISFLFPNIDTCKGMKEWSRAAASDILSPLGWT